MSIIKDTIKKELIFDSYSNTFIDGSGRDILKLSNWSAIQDNYRKLDGDINFQEAEKYKREFGVAIAKTITEEMGHKFTIAQVISILQDQNNLHSSIRYFRSLDK